MSTIAGNNGGSNDGQGTSASFYYPNGITSDSSGNLYVADTDNHRIRKISSTGLVSTIAGNGEGSNDLSVNSLKGIAADSIGNLYVADINKNRIRKILEVTAF